MAAIIGAARTAFSHFSDMTLRLIRGIVKGAVDSEPYTSNDDMEGQH